MAMKSSETNKKETTSRGSEVVKEYYTIKEVCEILNLSRLVVSKLIERNELPYIKINNRYRINIKAFREWEESHFGKQVDITVSDDDKKEQE